MTPSNVDRAREYVEAQFVAARSASSLVEYAAALDRLSGAANALGLVGVLSASEVEEYAARVASLDPRWRRK